MPYRYIGNKTAILPWLIEQIQRIAQPGSVVADPMCGTASVAAALRLRGYRVIASDLMTFALHHARVRLLLSQAPAFKGLGMSYSELLTELANSPKMEGLFYHEYSPAGSPAAGCPPRMYFTPENASRIDAIRDRIAGWHSQGLITQLERSLLLHDLIMSVNAVANIAGTYGHFRSKWSPSSLRSLKLEQSDFGSGPTKGHRVLQGRAEDLAPDISADVCYLDPPYKKRQYAANYHLIETLARGDHPEPIGVSGLRDWWDQYSDFCSKRKIEGAFEAIIEGMDCPTFLISYSEDGLIERNRLEEILGRFGEVSCLETQHKRFRSNNSSLAKNITEYLFVLQRKRSGGSPLYVRRYS